MKKIKDTLNLPKTGFSMKANLAQKEPEMIKYWEEIKLYDLLQSKNKDGPNFLLHDGPPYANGPIHLGTTNNKVLKDIIIKFKQLQGFNSPYIPGWDCHGLPIELNVEEMILKGLGFKQIGRILTKLCLLIMRLIPSGRLVK
jgi:isoleucyl-tRNA synthetase